MLILLVSGRSFLTSSLTLCDEIKLPKYRYQTYRFWKQIRHVSKACSNLIKYFLSNHCFKMTTRFTEERDKKYWSCQIMFTEGNCFLLQYFTISMHHWILLWYSIGLHCIYTYTVLFTVYCILHVGPIHVHTCSFCCIFMHCCSFVNSKIVSENSAPIFWNQCTIARPVYIERYGPDPLKTRVTEVTWNTGHSIFNSN